MTEHSARLPPEAYGAALAALPGMGPARLAAVLDRQPPDEAWARLFEGRTPAAAPGTVSAATMSTWTGTARATDVAGVWSAYKANDVGVHVLGHTGYPAALAADHDAPRVLFHRGDLGAIEGTRAAIVGTRRCTRYGHDLAREMGRELARAGVRVVSGLALGIDGAAHHGVLEVMADGGAPPVGVVGCGLDIVYPRTHGELWAGVAQAGVLLSEAPLGAAPEPWRFPARNRIIAALGTVVVVVESHARGGSRHTVDEAEARSRPVLAVPGSVRSPASTFTNELLAEGCHPARDVTDVLVALGLNTSANGATAVEHRPTPDFDGARVLDALGWEAATLDQVAARTGQSPAQLSLALNRLERDGWVTVRSGWWERVTVVAG
jgi:DNA processing protein